MSFNLTQIATDLISNLGYGGLSIGLVVDSLGVPIPSEVLVPVATILASMGRFNYWAVFIIGTLAQVAGGVISYYIGRIGGRPAVEKFGRYVLISKRDLERTQTTFAKYGRWMAAAGRCLPVIRGLVGYPAGIAEMPIGEFIAWTTLGSAVWTGLLMYLGHILSQNIDEISSILNKFSIVVILLIIVAIIFHVRHALSERRDEQAVVRTPKA